MPGGLIPAAVAQSSQPFEIPGKEGLIILNDRPVNAETPAHLLDDDVTPAKYLFVRNNGTPPVAPISILTPGRSRSAVSLHREACHFRSQS